MADSEENKKADLFMIPGPTRVPEQCRALYANQYDSPDLDPQFVKDYSSAESKLKGFLGCKNEDVVIMSGEGMLALWAGIKSVLQTGDLVVSIATGVFGYGIADMIAQLGCEVHRLGLEFDEAFDSSLPGNRVNELKAMLEKKPKLVTMVHCETPSGTLNDIEYLRTILDESNCEALLYVDFVASAGSIPVNVHQNKIDIGCLGSQKVLSLPPDLSMVSVSLKAWEVIESVKYAGYDALLPWKNVKESAYFPYTHNWRAISALNLRLEDFKDMNQWYEKHDQVAKKCRVLCKEVVELFPKNGFSPSCTALKVPEGFTFDALNKALLEHGVHVAGSYGKIAGKVFRIGHMGTQCEIERIEKIASILKEIVAK